MTLERRLARMAFFYPEGYIPPKDVEGLPERKEEFTKLYEMEVLMCRIKGGKFIDTPSGRIFIQSDDAPGGLLVVHYRLGVRDGTAFNMAEAACDHEYRSMMDAPVAQILRDVKNHYERLHRLDGIKRSLDVGMPDFLRYSL